MKVTGLTIELMVDDIQKTINFYKTMLGFEVTVSVPEKEPFFVVMSSGSAKLMLYTRSQFSEEIPEFKEIPVGGSIAMYMNVDNIETLFGKIKGKVKIIQELHETDYGTKEFSFEDCNGYIIMLANEK